MSRSSKPSGAGRVSGLKRHLGRGRGQAIPEFALVLPVLMLLMLGAVDFGRIFFSYIAVRNAAAQGAAYGAANPTDTAGITSRVQQETNTQAQAGENTLAVTSSCKDGTGNPIACSSAAGGGGAGNQITVTVSEPFSFFTPLISNFFGGSFSLGASATAVVLGMAPGPGSTQPPGCTTPVAAFGYTLNGPYGISLDASASTPNSGQWAIASYLWTMGDGGNPNPPVTGKITSYTYATSGTLNTFLVTLTVQNQCGSATATQAVIIGPAPTPSPSPTPAPTATPGPTATPLPQCNTSPTFTYTESGNSGNFSFQGAYTGQPAPLTWAWTFGDGATGSGQNVSHHYTGSKGTSYTVTLRVTDTSGTCVRQYSHTVTV